MNMTVAEIGRRAGCSSATVSRALNNSGSVSPKTREAVLNVLKQTAYPAKRQGGRGRRFMKALSASDSGLVEIIAHRQTPMEPIKMDHGRLSVGPLTAGTKNWVYSDSNGNKLSNSYYRRLMDGIVAELARWGHKAVLQTSNDLLSPEVLVDMNRTDRLGILLLGEYSPDQSAFIEQCTHPLVLVDIIHHSWPDIIAIDNFSGIFDTFNHLYGLGHRRIGFIGKRDGVAAFEERFMAYKLKLAEADLPLRMDWVFEGPNIIDLTAEGVKKILQRDDRPTAFVCANDVYALGVLRAASGLGVRIPKDLSVTGFDDEDMAAVVTPALTTAHVAFERMGALAVRQLMIQVETGLLERMPGADIRLRPELIIRQSTAKPA